MEEDGKIWYGIGIDNSQLKNDADESRRLLRSIGNEGENAGNAIDVALGRVGKTIAAAFSVKALSDFTRNIIKVRSEIESLEISFNTLLGNKDKAAEMLGEIREFAVKTPMMISDLAKGAKTLLSFNVAAEKVMPTLKAIGDISMGDAGKFQSLTLAFAQMSSTGKLMGQDLLQMINAGFNPLAEISERTGKSIADLKEEMSKGAISAEMVTQAFMDATSEGGKFNGMLEEQSKGLTGSISNLKGAFDDMLNDLGEKMQDSVSGVVQHTTEIVRNYEKVGDALAVLIAGYGSYKAAVIATNLVMKASTFADNIRLVMMFRKELGLLKAAQQAFNLSAMSNPYIIMASAIIAATVAIAKLVKHKREEEQAIIDSTKEMRNEYTQTNMLIGKLKDSNLKEEERKKILDQLRQVNPDIVKGIEDEATAFEKLNERLEEYNKKQLAAIAVKQFSKREDFEEAVEDLINARDKMESANADMVDLWSSIYDRYLGMLEKGEKIPESIKSMMDSLIESGASEAEKVEAVFSAWRQIEDRINQSHGAYSGISDGRYTFQALLGGLSDREYRKTAEKLDKIEGVYKEKAETLKAKIQQIALSVYTTDEAARQQFIDSQMALYFPESNQQTPPPPVENQEEKRNKAYWEAFKKKKEDELAALTDAELTTKKAVEIRKQIAEAERKIAAYSVSYKDSGRIADETAERRARKNDYVQARIKEEQAAEFEIRQAAINAQKEGFDKQIQQARLDYDRLIAANEERKRQMVESMRDEKLNEWMISHPKATKEQQLAFRATISENDLTEEQKAIIKQYEVMAAEMQQKANKEALEGMLLEYGDYAEQKKAIDNQYLSDLSFATVAFFNATTEDEKERYANLIKDIGKNKAKAILDLSLASIDSTVYDTIEEKMQAINSAYQEYIKNLEDAGASEAEINAATAEQVELTGTLTTLNAKLADIEARIRNLQQGGTDKEGKTLSDLLKMKAEVESELKSAESKSFKELWDAQKNTLVANSIDQVTNALYRLAEASGSLNAEQAADFMSSLSKGLQGFQSGAFIGLLIAGIEDTIAQITDAVVAVEAIESAVNDAKLDKWKADMESLMEQGNGSIFGTDSLANVNGMVSVLEEARKKMEDLNGEAQEFDYWDFNRVLEWTNALSWRNWADIFGAETRNNVNTYFDAINKGYTELEAHVFRTNNHGWLLNFFGVDDEYTSFKDLTEKLGYEMYDEFGNLNKDALEAILEAYGDQLSDEDKEWLEKAIAYCDEYKSAMEGIAEYLSSLFGQVADTIADNFINSFLESGEAAAKFGNVVSDVAKSMVKDLIKSKILAALDPFSQQLQDIMAGDGTQDEKIAAMMAVFASMQEAMDALTPEMQAILESYQQFFEMGDSEREPSSRGIAQASQDSVDELNGRMTAVQGHTYSISENTILIQQNTANIMQSVMNIERDVNDMDNRIYSMETMTTQMRNTLDDFRQNGIRIR